MQYLDKVKEYLGITDCSYDQKILLTAISTDTKVRAYCNILDKTLSTTKEAALQSIILEMIIKLVSAMNLTSTTTSIVTTPTGLLSKKTIGDVTLEYDTSSEAVSASSSSSSTNISILSEYSQILKPFITKRTLMI